MSSQDWHCRLLSPFHALTFAPRTRCLPPSLAPNPSFLPNSHYPFFPCQVGDKAGISIPRACCTGLCGTCTSDLRDPSYTFKGEDKPAGAREGYQTIRACSTQVTSPSHPPSLPPSLPLLSLFPLCDFPVRPSPLPPSLSLPLSCPRSSLWYDFISPASRTASQQWNGVCLSPPPCSLL
jgi:hypothetical protein